MTEGAYRLSAYRALPTGWSPSPSGVGSDLHLWRKFLARDELRFGTRIVVTTVKFAMGRRGDWSLDRRLAEITAWAQKLSSPGGRDAVAQEALRQLSQMAYDLRLQVERLDKAAKDSAARTEELNEQLSQVRAELGDSLRRSDKLHGKLRALRRTLSWRLTRPFRKL
ncbi:MAG: hypothetical protein ACREDG_02690, partial [Methylocella sp.]